MPNVLQSTMFFINGLAFFAFRDANLFSLEGLEACFSVFVDDGRSAGDELNYLQGSIFAFLVFHDDKFARKDFILDGKDVILSGTVSGTFNVRNVMNMGVRVGSDQVVFTTFHVDGNERTSIVHIQLGAGGVVQSLVESNRQSGDANQHENQQGDRPDEKLLVPTVLGLKRASNLQDFVMLVLVDGVGLKIQYKKTKDIFRNDGTNEFFAPFTTTRQSMIYTFWLLTPPSQSAILLLEEYIFLSFDLNKIRKGEGVQTISLFD